jgi:hypothetical protein
MMASFGWMSLMEKGAREQASSEPVLSHPRRAGAKPRLPSPEETDDFTTGNKNTIREQAMLKPQPAFHRTGRAVLCR